MRGGAVPVYKGAPEVLQHVPLRSVILADDFADAAALGAHLTALVADAAAYRRHFEWDLQEFAARPTARPLNRSTMTNSQMKPTDLRALVRQYGRRSVRYAP